MVSHIWSSEALHDLVSHRRQGSPNPHPHFARGTMGDGEPPCLPWDRDGCPCRGSPLILITVVLRCLLRMGKFRGEGACSRPAQPGLPSSLDSQLWGRAAPGPPPTPHPCAFHALPLGAGRPEASWSPLSCPSLLGSPVPVPAASMTLFLGPQGATGGEQRACCGSCSLRGPALQLEAEELPPE